MNSRLDKLKPYPFERLNSLLAKANPSSQEMIRWSIGEPAGSPPQFVLDQFAQNMHLFGKYPSTKGFVELRESICDWLTTRFSIKHELLDPEQNVLPVSGTREALFSIAHSIVESRDEPYVVFPNPFYQIYEGATILSGARTHLLNSEESNGFNPDFSQVSKEVWNKCAIVYICSPSNPTGACLSLDQWKELIGLSNQYNFVIAADECYSEIYKDEGNPPMGLLEAAHKLGVDDFENCLVFHSLSKRSNLPGMRSGFIAGDKNLLNNYFLYRTYHGCTISPPAQKASIAAWGNEDHVIENRKNYRANFKAVIEIVDPNGKMRLSQPEGSFYLWFKTPYNEEKFAFDLFEQEHLQVLPGSYLSRDNNNYNPGKNRVRMALVANTEKCREGANRLKSFLDRNA